MVMELQVENCPETWIKTLLQRALLISRCCSPVWGADCAPSQADATSEQVLAATLDVMSRDAQLARYVKQPA